MGSYPCAHALSILRELQSLGFCAGLKIPDAAATSDRPSEAFDAVLAAFLREAYPGGREARPLPVSLGDGRRVDLLRLFVAVRAAGGYTKVASSPCPGVWAAASQSAGLDAAVAAPVKLIYAKYLAALDRWIQRLWDARGPFLDGDERWAEELFLDANGKEKEELFLGCNGRVEQQHVVLKRKREDMAGMLDWVRGLAENVGNDASVAAGSADGYLSIALAVRQAVIRKRARRSTMTNGALLQGKETMYISAGRSLLDLEQSSEVFPIGFKCCMSSTDARIDAQAKCSKELQLAVEHPGSDTNESTTIIENLSGSSMVIEPECNLNGQGIHECKKKRKKPISSDGWLFTSQQRNKIPVGSNYQAHVPQWTGVLPVNYDDPETLKWLGKKVWPLEDENIKPEFYSDPIGKGRESFCCCKLPQSVECVRFHIAERRFQLRRELGSTFYAWGFDHMGEEIALLWTDDEEANFKAIMRVNAPFSGRNVWNRLRSSFRLKRRKELVSYYFNCFLLRRRCYQNRITPKNIDSDDDEETEFGFLGNRLGQSAAKYHSTKHTVCVQSTHCMDLDQ